MPGADSDYTTSPALSTWFGYLIGRYVTSMWRAVGEPDTFTVVEVGPGNGALAESVLSSGDEIGPRLRWHCVEPFTQIRAAQQETLGEFGGRVTWSHKLHEVGVEAGCVLANEVLDNFPVRLFEVQSRAAAEVHVTWSGDRLVEVLVPYERDDAADTIAYAVDHLEDGDRFEVSPLIAEWAAAAYRAIGNGYLVVIDYGDVEPDLWIKRPSGSIVTYYRGQLGTDPLIDVGSRDITAHVDLSELGRAANAAGFTAISVESQRSLLHRIGLDDVLARLRAEQRAAESAGRHDEALALMAEWSRAASLTTRGGLGDLMVITAAKGAPPLGG